MVQPATVPVPPRKPESGQFNLDSAFTGTVHCPAQPKDPIGKRLEPRYLNGVRITTKDGRWRTRFSDAERLKACGATERDLDDFMNLFCFGAPRFATTASDDPRDWVIAKRHVARLNVDSGGFPFLSLSRTNVLRHLLGDSFPGQPVKWIAPYGSRFTKFIAIDVDCHGDKRDARVVESYSRRCDKVELTLESMGITKEMWLRSPTPSGGCHYRFFLDRPVLFQCGVFEAFNLTEFSGSFEFYPRLNKAIRLPFGKIPNRRHDPTKWVKFIRKYRRKGFPLVDWSSIRQEADARFYATKPDDPVPQQANERAQCRRDLARVCVKKTLTSIVEPISSGARSEYDQILSSPPNPRNVQRLIELGIQAEGTRYAATKRIAWNLIFVRRLSAEVATQQLVEWVYRTGKTTSKDVREDIANGTHHVRQQTAEIVAWCVKRLDEREPMQPSVSSTRGPSFWLTLNEIETVVLTLSRAGCYSVRTGEFALRCLWFAKQHGEKIEVGWAAAIAAGKVMRGWPRCGGGAYKQRRTELEEVGLISMLREKRQTPNGTGRARTYRIHIRDDIGLREFKLEEAIAELRRRMSEEAPDEPIEPRPNSAVTPEPEVIIDPVEENIRAVIQQRLDEGMPEEYVDELRALQARYPLRGIPRRVKVEYSHLFESKYEPRQVNAWDYMR